MDPLRITARALFVYAFLLVLLRVSGKRAVRQSSTFDFVLSLIVGEVLQRTGKYDALWVIAGSAYVLTWGLVHLLTPRLEPAQLDPA